MASITVSNLPDEAHRALCARAAHHDHSTEAEIRAIPEAATHSPERVKLGSLLISIAREAGGLTDAEAGRFDRRHNKTLAEPMRFE